MALLEWDPSNDRDFIGLGVTSISAAPSHQRQWTQEVRYGGYIAGPPRSRGGVRLPTGTRLGPVLQAGTRRRRRAVLLAPGAAAATPGLLDGYGFNQELEFRNTSAALFGQVEWAVTDRLRVLPGLRFNYDQKQVDFDQQVYGGLQTTDPVRYSARSSRRKSTGGR